MNKERCHIEIDFFPERGSLADNVNSIVAFKAVEAHGKGCNVVVRSLSLPARKEIIKTIILRINSLSNNLKLPLEDLTGGITILTLLSPDDLPLAERLIFTGRGDEMKISIIPQTGEEVAIEYFNADNASTVTISVEGITSSGVPLTSSAEYRIPD